MKLIPLIFVAATALTAIPAMAQDVDPVFTGPRVEGFGGVDFQHYKINPTPAGAETKHTGGVAGVLGGFDIGVGGLVVGAFGSYALPTSNFCASRPAFLPDQCVRPEREIEGGARVGVKFGPRALVYGKGAYVNTSVKVQSTFTAGGTFNTHVNEDGWRVGAGAEYALAEHAYIKVEYDYTQTSRFSLQPYGFANTDYRQTKSQVLGGFGVRF
ncbi:outer membrane protein [uncultured Sphingomonas sp.]|uniref:outer membrane protein n=1 Tax=uncultured Sphingomonas sp. TaxID=158754 RepID=UPI0035CA709C